MSYLYLLAPWSFYLKERNLSLFFLHSLMYQYWIFCLQNWYCYSRRKLLLPTCSLSYSSKFFCPSVTWQRSFQFHPPYICITVITKSVSLFKKSIFFLKINNSLKSSSAQILEICVHRVSVIFLLWFEMRWNVINCLSEKARNSHWKLFYKITVLHLH